MPKTPSRPRPCRPGRPSLPSVGKAPREDTSVAPGGVQKHTGKRKSTRRLGSGALTARTAPVDTPRPRNAAPALRNQAEPAALAAAMPPRPGGGLRVVQGALVQLEPLSQTGFYSSFDTPFSRQLAVRATARIHEDELFALNANEGAVRAGARQDMVVIHRSMLSEMPATAELIARDSVAAALQHPSFSVEYIQEAIDHYRNEFGDNFYMNVAAMGFAKIPEYLDAMWPDFPLYPELDKARGRELAFCKMHAAQYGAALELQDPGDVEGALSRLHDMQLHATVFSDFLRSGDQPISRVTVAKGMKGGNDPTTTQLSGLDFMKAAYSGKGILFNWFLSSSSNIESAAQFSGKFEAQFSQAPLYTVDFTNHSPMHELLRRQSMADLEHGKCAEAIDSIIVVFQTLGAMGKDINAACQTDRRDRTLTEMETKEAELTFAPGHCMHPRQIIRSHHGFVIVASLEDSLRVATPLPALRA